MTLDVVLLMIVRSVIFMMALDDWDFSNVSDRSRLKVLDPFPPGSCGQCTDRATF